MRRTGRYPETSGLSREEGQAPRRELLGPSDTGRPWEKESPPLLLGDAGGGAGDPPLGPPGSGGCPGASGRETSARFAEVPVGEVPVAAPIPKRLRNPQPVAGSAAMTPATAGAGGEVSATSATNVSGVADVRRIFKGSVVERGFVVGALNVAGALVAIRLTTGVVRLSRLTAGRLTAGRLTAGVVRPSRLTAGRLTAGVVRLSRLTAGRLTAGVVRLSRLSGGEADGRRGEAEQADGGQAEGRRGEAEQADGG